MLGSDNLYSPEQIQGDKTQVASAYVLQHRCTQFLVTQFPDDVI